MCTDRQADSLTYTDRQALLDRQTDIAIRHQQRDIAITH